MICTRHALIVDLLSRLWTSTSIARTFPESNTKSFPALRSKVSENVFAPDGLKFRSHSLPRAARQERHLSHFSSSTTLPPLSSSATTFCNPTALASTSTNRLSSFAISMYQFLSTASLPNKLIGSELFVSRNPTPFFQDTKLESSPLSENSQLPNTSS